MRVFYGSSSLRVVRGESELLTVSGQLGSNATPDNEGSLREFPERLQSIFNGSYSRAGYILKDVSEPIIYMPNEFEFHIDFERLPRLAREVVVACIPLEAEVWQAGHEPIAELWIGDRGDLLQRKERDELGELMREIGRLPTKGKVFVLGEDLTGIDRAAARAAIRETLGGTLQEAVSVSTDYYLTNRDDLAKSAKAARAKRTIDKLIFATMNWGKA